MKKRGEGHSWYGGQSNIRNEGAKGQELRGREHPRKEGKKEAEGGTSTLSPVKFWAPSLLCPRPESAKEERCDLHSPGPRDTPSGACSSLRSPSALSRSLRRKGRAGKAPAFRKTNAQSDKRNCPGPYNQSEGRAGRQASWVPTPVFPPDCT